MLERISYAIAVIFGLIIHIFCLWCQCYGFAFVLTQFFFSELNVLTIANVFFLVGAIISVCIAILNVVLEKKD